MANAVAAGAQVKGADVSVMGPSDFGAAVAGEYDGIALGCPAMGAEQLEEAEYQPMWDEVKGELSGKKVALFGSYGWGDGEWMRMWEDEAKEAGANLVADGLMINGAPDDDGEADCKALGAALA
jgi:flavodoxin short chain